MRIATGQAIEDGSGTNRLGISFGGTSLLDQDGRITIHTNHDSYTRVEAFSTQPFIIRDEQGSFNAIRYDTGTSVGTFALPNSYLKAQAMQNDGTRGAIGVQMDDDTSNTSKSQAISFTNSDGEVCYLFMENENLIYEDSTGSTTQLN
jgi:hypothetical protein